MNFWGLGRSSGVGYAKAKDKRVRRWEDLWDKLDGSESALGSCANLLSLCAMLLPEFMHERPICNKVLGAVG